MALPVSQAYPTSLPVQESNPYKELESRVLAGDYPYVEGFCAAQSKAKKNFSFLHLCSMEMNPLTSDKTEKLIKSLEILLSCGVEINSMDKEGETGLHKACRTNNIKVVEFLLRHGANRTIFNSSGKTPLQIAEEQNFVEIVKLLNQGDLIFIDRFNVMKFLQLTKNSLAEVDNATKVKASFLTGNSGVGKTTLINWKEGCYYMPNEEDQLEVVGEKKEVIPTSNKLISDTKTLRLYGKWIDSPGKEDNRGPEFDASADVSFCELFDSGNVENIIFAIPALLFKEKRCNNLCKAFKSLGEMIADYEKISKSIHFVITQTDIAPKSFPRSVKKFLELRDKKILEFTGDEKEDAEEKTDSIPPEELYHAVHCLKMMNESNILLADFSLESESLRMEFLARLERTPSLPPGALQSGLKGERMIQLQKIVDAFFEKIVTPLKKDVHTKNMLDVARQRIALLQQDLAQFRLQKYNTEKETFNPPKESLNNRDNLRNYFLDEILKLQKDKITLVKEIEDCGQSIFDIQRKPQGRLNRSLIDLNNELTGLQVKLKGLDTEDLENVYDDHFKEKRMAFFGKFSWSYHKFEYKNKELPYKESYYWWDPKKAKFKNFTNHPDTGHFSAEYVTNYGADGNAYVTLKATKKIYHKKEIESLENNIRDLTPVINEKNALVQQHQKRIIDNRTQILNNDQKERNLVAQIEALNRQDLQDLAIFNARIEVLRVASENDKRRKIEEIQSKIETAEKEFRVLEGRIKTYIEDGVTVAEDLAYVMKTYDPEKINTMKQVVKISRIRSVAFQEYMKMAL